MRGVRAADLIDEAGELIIEVTLRGAQSEVGEMAHAQFDVPSIEQTVVLKKNLRVGG